MSVYTASTARGEYCVSKAGLSMARQLWAARLAGEGIGVYEIRPGIMATDMTSAVKGKYDALIADGLLPQNRWGTAEDVGRAVASLVRGDFAYSAGAVIDVDGGFSCAACRRPSGRSGGRFDSRARSRYFEADRINRQESSCSSSRIH